MNLQILQPHSIKTRVTLFTLAIFLVSIWVLSLVASRLLQTDMQRVLGEQQLSTASFIASGVNDELGARLKAMEAVAETITPALLNDANALQRFLENHVVLVTLFNGGISIVAIDGTAIADVPRSNGRTGVNYITVDYVAANLKEGKTMIGKPIMGPTLKAPVVGMGVPIRDTQGQVIGALSGVIRLDKPNFLDKITQLKPGTNVRYFVTAPQHGLNVTSSDKSRIMAKLPAPGVNPTLDRFAQGTEGTFVFVNPLGETVLVSAKAIPVANWYAAATLGAEEAFAPVRQMQQRIFLTAVVLTLLAGLLTLWMLRRELAPLLHTVQTLTLFANSDQPPQALPVARDDEIGKLIGSFNSLIASLAQRDAALRESQQQFAEAERVAHLGHWQMDLVIGQMSWSDEVFRLFEIDPKHSVATHAAFLEAVHPDDLAAVDQNYTQLLESRLPQESTYRLRMPDGRIKWVYSKCNSEFDVDGKPLRIRGVVQDVTERQQSEAVDAFLAQAGSHPGGEPFFAALARFLAQSLQMDYICIDRLEGDQLRATTLAVWYDGHFEDNLTYALSDTPCGDVVGQTVCCFPASVCQLFPKDAALRELRAESYIGVTLWGHDHQPIGLIAVIGRRALVNRSMAEATLARVAVRAAGELERLNAETQQQLAASVFVQAREGIMITKADGTIIDVNASFTRITGYTRDEALGCNPRFLKSGRHDANYFAAMWQGLIAQGYWSGEIWNRRKNGEIFAEQQTISAVCDASGCVQHYVSLFSDISERKALEHQVYQMAYFDALTGLPNRRMLDDRLGLAMASSKRSGLHGALMFLDLDNFKPLNDTHGHEVGDLLLIEVARRLTECLREVDTVARFGGDEFVVMLSELDVDKTQSVEQARGVAEKIRASLAIPYVLTQAQPGRQAKTVEHDCSTSIGVVVFFNHEASQTDIMKWADAAMYQAKEAGRNRVRFYQGD